MTIRIHAMAATLAIAATFSAAADQDTKDATGVDVSKLPTTYTMPNAAYAYYGGTANHALASDQASRADLADTATTAESADLATNALALDGRASAYYLDASNLSAGVLPIDRLIGSILSETYRVNTSLLSGTYDISITGNANTATYATQAGSATQCTGGPAGCDY